MLQNRFAKFDKPDLLVIAGEASGDEHAARVVLKLKETHPQLRVTALAGRALHEAGATMLDDLTAHSAVGLWEVIKKLHEFLALLDETVRWIRENKPKAVMLTDFVGFNLELAKRLYDEKISSKAGGSVKIYFYVSPQIWAWKSHRRFNMARWLDSLGVIFPFEVDVYKDTQLPVEFVGHPFVADDFKNPIAYDPEGPVLLLPGSRKAIVQKHLPILWNAFRLFTQTKTGQSKKVAAYYANETQRRQMLKITHGELPLYPAQAPIKASAVLTTAGTISVLTALAGVPGAVLYKTDPLTYCFGRSVYKLPFLGMPNLLLRRELMKEFIQQQATPAQLCQRLCELYEDPAHLKAAQRGAEELTLLLGRPTHSAAEWIAGALK